MRDGPDKRRGHVEQRADVSSAATVVQAGRDAEVTLEHHVHHHAPLDRTRSPYRWWPRIRSRETTNRVFLVMSTFSRKYWVLEFVRHLHHALDRRNLDLVLKVPDRDHDAAALAHDLRRVLTTRRGYLGGFVWPTELGRLRPQLAEFCAELALPVVFTDMEPFADEHEYPVDTAFVGYSSADLGDAAGRWLVNHLRARGVRRPRVLVVASHEHPDRQIRCAERLRTAFEDATITIDDTCDFRRTRAHDAVQARIRDWEAHQVSLDAVFCTSDDMALGAVDAIRGTPARATADTVVVGVDGIPEARDLIAAGSPLRATVVQDSHRLAESAVEVLQRLVEGRRTGTRTILKPEVLHGANGRT